MFELQHPMKRVHHFDAGTHQSAASDRWLPETVALRIFGVASGDARGTTIINRDGSREVLLSSVAKAAGLSFGQAKLRLLRDELDRFAR
jgi:hypothetical protein